MALDPVLSVRRNTDEPTAEIYSDTELSDRLVAAAGSVATVCRDIWKEKMASAASLVNTSEGGSSRGMKDLFDRAKAMHDFWAAQTSDEASAGKGITVLHRLSR
jgi:hypothetical protein